MILLPPFNGFALGAGMNFNNILRAGISGIVLGLLTVLATGLLTFFLYSALRRKADPMGAAIGTTAGVATTTPTAVPWPILPSSLRWKQPLPRQLPPW